MNIQITHSQGKPEDHEQSYPNMGFLEPKLQAITSLTTAVVVMVLDEQLFETLHGFININCCFIFFLTTPKKRLPQIRGSKHSKRLWPTEAQIFKSSW